MRVNRARSMNVRSRSARISLFASLLVVVRVFGNPEEVEELIVDPSWHGPSEPILSLEDPKVLSDRNAQVFALEEHCRSDGDLPAHPGESCIEKLNDYFGSVPIWRGTTACTYTGTRARCLFSAYDGRSTRMRYNEIDFLYEEVPTWNDIFDGNEEDRLITVAGVFANKACLALREPGRINRSYINRCEARELFKYARYLDACMTGISWSNRFNEGGRREGKSRYERARETMNPNEVVDHRNGNGWQLVENYLRSILVTRKCKELHFVSVDDYIVNASREASFVSIDEMTEQMQPMYDASMAIAARAGDPWAIQAYYEKQMASDVAYWKSVYEINPLLFHRWMSSIQGRKWFDNVERILHAWQAYTIAKSFIPSLERVAFDRYILDHGDRFTDAEMMEAKAALSRENWKSDLEYPWNLVPEAFKEIHRNIRSYEESRKESH